jgi:hypothetical protein
VVRTNAGLHANNESRKCRDEACQTTFKGRQATFEEGSRKRVT